MIHIKTSRQTQGAGAKAVRRPAYIGLVAGKQPAKDTDTPADEQEAHGKKQQGIACNRGNNRCNLRKDSSSHRTQVRQKTAHNTFLHS